MVNSFLFVVIIRLDRIIHSSLTWIPAFAGMTTPRSIICLSQLFLNRVFDILIRGVAAEHFVINRNIGRLDRIVSYDRNQGTRNKLFPLLHYQDIFL